MENELRALTMHALYADFPCHCLDDPLADVQAESSACLVKTLLVLQFSEVFEELGKVTALDPDAGVLDLQPQSGFLGAFATRLDLVVFRLGLLLR